MYIHKKKNSKKKSLSRDNLELDIWVGCTKMSFGVLPKYFYIGQNNVQYFKKLCPILVYLLLIV